MARSSTVWAAALILASFSGSGRILTTAEAMPAPGPQETPARPRYYFPRHIKRQIVTNITAPAEQTPSASSSSSLMSRKFDLGHELGQLFSGHDHQPPTNAAPNGFFGTGDTGGATTATSSEGSNNLTPLPRPGGSLDPNQQLPGNQLLGAGNQFSGTGNQFPGTGNQIPSSTPAGSAPASSAPAHQAEGDTLEAGSPTPNPQPSSSGLPDDILQPTPSPSPSPSPAPVPISSAPSDLLNGLMGLTGLPPTVLFPSPSPSPIASSAPVDPETTTLASTSLPSDIVTPTSTPVTTPEPSASPLSSFTGPFFIGSTSEVIIIPSSEILPSSIQSTSSVVLSSWVDVPTSSPTPDVSSTGVLPTSDVIQPTSSSPSPSSEQPSSTQPTSTGIVVGITTAIGTTSVPDVSTVVSSDIIPTSEVVVTSTPPDLSSSVPVPPTTTGAQIPTAASSGIQPPLSTSLVPDVSSVVPSSVLPSNVISVTDLPTTTVIASSIASGLVPSSLYPGSSGSGISPSGAVPTQSESVIITSLVPSETPTIIPSSVSSSLILTSAIPTASGILPSGVSGTGASTVPIVTTATIASTSWSPYGPSSSAPSPAPASSAGINVTVSETATFVVPTTSIVDTTAVDQSVTLTAVVTSKPTPVQSQRPIGTDSATSLVVGTWIIQETTDASPSPTSVGIPSTLPKMIAPPDGVPTTYPPNSFMGQICFKWELNYQFVSANDGGNQIFHYLPMAIATALNITMSQVTNIGLKPLDTTSYLGFVTTVALFTIPANLQDKLQAELRNPADVFWHNPDQTVNDLTKLINTACPLPAGQLPADGSANNQAGGGGTTSTGNGGSADGGALGGDINASRPVNASAAGIAAGAVCGAIAYGAAMFFVARRYRHKRAAHQRSSSVPSTGSRMTSGSIPGGAAAWMHGARNGRMSPGSRGSQGSDSSQGHSVRTQQISAPVMAENSLGWN
ncbi:hypothetical protein ACEQ8H_002877 [Pleosporales sp. CAS-2024a]